jgi:hypothetical protein
MTISETSLALETASQIARGERALAQPEAEVLKHTLELVRFETVACHCLQQWSS